MKSASRPPVFRKPPPTPSKPNKSKKDAKDPVEVFCRLRPLRDPTDKLGAYKVSDTVVQLAPPANELGIAALSSLRNVAFKETQYTFKYVFDENQSQKAVFKAVSKQLVQDLLQGKNGLLFTYGVTGSGKTYTMTGSLLDGGILPRCLDVIFNSIGSLQARKYVFKPDKMNGFEIQSDADAMLERQKEILYVPPTPKSSRKKLAFDFEDRVCDDSKVDTVDEDSSYAVFIQYIEIYKNYVYDLLDDSPIDLAKTKGPQSKMLRKDETLHMYVFGCTEVEVKNTEEVFEYFYKGQKRRKVAHTELNSESSRSHSVFTIRLVQIPFDASGREIIQDKNAIMISQLSLVDLAGSERMTRTQNHGERIKEANSINSSLMKLRQCIETLRENQLEGTNKMVPYRDSKLTYLFKNYFDGEGKVKMIVCINPSMEDYNENLQVMAFAELAQEVQITRPTPSKLDAGLLPNRRRVNALIKENKDKLAEIRADIKPLLDAAITPAYSLPHRISTFKFGLSFPDFDLYDETVVPKALHYCDKRAEFMEASRKHLEENISEFRNTLVENLKELELLRQKNQNLENDLHQSREKVAEYEAQLTNSDKSIEYLKRQLEKKTKEKSSLQIELKDVKAQISAEQIEKFRIQEKIGDKIQSEREKMNRELNKKNAQIQARMMLNDEKMRCLRDVLSEKWVPSKGVATKRKQPLQDASTSDQKISEEQERSRERHRMRSTSQSPERGIPVANPRHRRSRSASDVWLDHAPTGTVELGTMLQPSLKRKKSVTKLNAKDLLSKDTAHYVLTHQEQDRHGDIETTYFKGNIVPSCTGGAQVIFQEVETLKQTSPPGSRKRSSDWLKKHSESNGNDVEAKCSTGIEGHMSRKKSRPY